MLLCIGGVGTTEQEGQQARQAQGRQEEEEGGGGSCRVWGDKGGRLQGGQDRHQC